MLAKKIKSFSMWLLLCIHTLYLAANIAVMIDFLLNANAVRMVQLNNYKSVWIYKVVWSLYVRTLQLYSIFQVVGLSLSPPGVFSDSIAILIDDTRASSATSSAWVRARPKLIRLRSLDACASMIAASLRPLICSLVSIGVVAMERCISSVEGPLWTWMSLWSKPSVRWKSFGGRLYIFRICCPAAQLMLQYQDLLPFSPCLTIPNPRLTGGIFLLTMLYISCRDSDRRIWGVVSIALAMVIWKGSPSLIFLFIKACSGT